MTLSSPSSRPLRICVVYDCLFPYTLGGAERWYRNLAQRLSAEGHKVTYLTLRQWDEGRTAEVDGVEVVAVGPRLSLYGEDGARRIGPPLRFGAGVLTHLIRHGRSYDVVHTASFPFFSLLAAAALSPLGGYQIVVDWHEFWSRSYWRRYLGPLKGWIGWTVQSLCARIPQRAFCFARLTAARIEAHGISGRISVLEGEYEGALEPRPPVAAEPLVVFAGRHIPEKRAGAVIPAVMLARERIPGLEGRIFGIGPESPELIDAAAGTAVRFCGRVESEVVEDALAGALCMMLPSIREGYGMVVIEAAALGTPSILVAGEDNAAVEHIEEGINGFVAASASPEDLADAIVRVHRGGAALRASTADWFARNARRLSLASSLETVLAVYSGPRPAPSVVSERLRYVLVSAFCVLLHNAIVISGAALGLHYAVATCVSFCILVCVGYTAHVYFTYKTEPSARSFAIYTGACLINLPLALAAMFAFCTIARLPVAVGTPLTSGVMFVFNYLGARLAIGPRAG